METIEATKSVGVYLSKEYAEKVASVLWGAGLRRPLVVRHEDATFGVAGEAWVVVVLTSEYDRASILVADLRHGQRLIGG